ncbi:MAG: DUF401 family protein [Candidatus Bathyarchaeia archaeon]
MIILDPIAALVVSFIFLGVMLYKRVSIGIALFATAILMSFVSMKPLEVANALLKTTTDPITISLVAVTFGIILLSLLYKETGALQSLSRSFSGLLRNPKLVASALPAIIGLLAVPGGALMSAPLVDSEVEKLGLNEGKKTYVNVWFRHIIFPVYPMSQIIILAATLTETPITSIIISQIPVVAAMIAVGYFVALKKTSVADDFVTPKTEFLTNSKNFLRWFSPILVMILTVALFAVDVSIAAFVGIAMLLLITKPHQHAFAKTFSNMTLYEIPLAAYGAMLLQKVTMASGISVALGHAIAGLNLNVVVLLAVLPAALGVLIGSPSASIAISVPIIAGIVSFTPNHASLLYISAFFGYLAAPTHLCLILTAKYFRCPLNKAYKFLLPSLAVAFAVALLVYHIL